MANGLYWSDEILSVLGGIFVADKDRDEGFCRALVAVAVALCRVQMPSDTSAVAVERLLLHTKESR